MKKRRTKSSRKTTGRLRTTLTTLPKADVNTVATSEELPYKEIDEKKLSKKELHELLANVRIQLNAAYERECRTAASIRQAHASLNEDRQKWLESTNRMKMDAKVTVIRASSAMIVALARMIGGDGF